MFDLYCAEQQINIPLLKIESFYVFTLKQIFWCVI